MWKWILTFLLVAGSALADPPTLLVAGDSNSVYPSYVDYLPGYFEISDELAAGGKRCDTLLTDVETYIAAHTTCPTVITFNCGTNDCLQDLCLDAAAIATVVGYVETFVTDALACGAVPVVMTPVPVAPKYAGAAHRITDMANLATAMVASGAANDYLVVDAHAAMTAYDAVAGQDMDDMYIADGVHLNTAGDPVVDSVLTPALEQLVERPSWKKIK